MNKTVLHSIADPDPHGSTSRKGLPDPDPGGKKA